MRSFTILKFVIIALVFSFFENSHAQIVIGKPNLGFTQACASSSFNSYNITISFSPQANINPTNQFIIELSDELGSFTNATVIHTTSEGEFPTSPATINFAFPTTVSGENYRLRVKSTAPVATSSLSSTFAAYYKLQDSQFSINNLIDTGVYCSGGSYLLTIDNPGIFPNDSPIKYPSLTFNWFKETSATTSILVSTGPTFEVDSPGTYFAATNYGTCTSNSYSNRVTVEASGAGTTTTNINSSLGNPYCSSDGATTLSTINGNSYQWYLNGEELDGATSQTYVTNEAGEYSVNIDLGECMASATINLENSGFTSSIDVSGLNMINDGETITATVTTDATSPIFEWYKNDTLINGATTNSFDATEVGDYVVLIMQTSGCMTVSDFEFSISNAFPNVSKIPNLISPNGDTENDTWVIPQEYISGTNTEVIIISSQGKIVLQTKDYQNNWPTEEIDFKNINPIYYYVITTPDNKIKKGSITVIK